MSAQIHLLRVYRGAPQSLLVYLEGCLVRATQDLAGVPAGALHRRFLRWVGESHRRTRR